MHERVSRSYFAGGLRLAHGTYVSKLLVIRHNGLRDMVRNHMHFMCGVPGRGLLRGMREDIEVLVWVDARAMIDAGMQILRSLSGVMLSRGQRSVIVPSFFELVELPKHK